MPEYNEMAGRVIFQEKSVVFRIIMASMFMLIFYFLNTKNKQTNNKTDLFHPLADEHP